MAFRRLAKRLEQHIIPEGPVERAHVDGLLHDFWLIQQILPICGPRRQTLRGPRLRRRLRDWLRPIGPEEDQILEEMALLIWPRRHVMKIERRTQVNDR